MQMNYNELPTMLSSSKLLNYKMYDIMCILVLFICMYLYS